MPGEMYKRIGCERLGISRSPGSNGTKPKPSTMKMIIVALALVAVAAAAPAEVATPEPPKIVRSDFSQQPDGTYNFAFETENGINRGETGEVKEILDEENKPHVVVTVRGSYSYTDKEGKVETINYYADETGFHAEGDSIPKPPASRR